MVAETQSTPARDWRTRFAHWLGLGPVPADVAGEVASLAQTVAALAVAHAANQEALGALLDTLTTLRQTNERLERQVSRSGKEQFKANALTEAQQQNVKSLMEQLHEADGYRERELTNLRERLVTARRDGRMEVINRLLPVADGLSEAVASGERIGEMAKQQIGKSANRQISKSANQQTNQSVGGFGERVGRAWARLWGRAGAEAEVEPSGGATSAITAGPDADEPAGQPRSESAASELTAWLEGLHFVQDRLLTVLDAEGVRPIETEGDTFDPRLHVAIETVPATEDTPSGTIVHETRRGYLAGETVLRYAEVVVAR
jgi:molecular chaperone GrpE